MHLFECTLRFGHMGSGKDWERAVRVKARDILQAMKRAKHLPGVKKGATPYLPKSRPLCGRLFFCPWNLGRPVPSFHGSRPSLPATGETAKLTVLSSFLGARP